MEDLLLSSIAVACKKIFRELSGLLCHFARECCLEFCLLFVLKVHVCFTYLTVEHLAQMSPPIQVLELSVNLATLSKDAEINSLLYWSAHFGGVDLFPLHKG